MYLSLHVISDRVYRDFFRSQTFELVEWQWPYFSFCAAGENFGGFSTSISRFTTIQPNPVRF
jgi:hypothetical protein